jgi:catechol 2,3-dioxygenase-like lactoylglutathione lyase family enzyme
MSSTDVHGGTATETAGVGTVDQKLEVVTLPVSDVDRAKAFYGETLGWRLDADFANGDRRVVQFTPPGSPASIHFGLGRTSATPGSAEGMFLIVTDIQAARDALVERGVEVSGIFHPDGPVGEPASGPAPDNASYGSFASFKDPDGNTWLLQEITKRLPGRVDSAETTYASVADLASALRRAEAAHGEHEARTGERDEEWPAWYAAYMAAEQSGAEPPQ